MAKPWDGTKIGSWAAEAEAEEQKLQAAAVTAAAAATNPQTFPSLKESVSAKPKKKKMTLSEFHESGSGATSTRLTHDEAVRLPTGPTMRDPDEYVPGSRGGSWGSGTRSGGFDGGTGPRREYDVGGPPPPPPPSRADEVDNWGSMKRNVPMERESRGGSGSDRYGGLEGGSRADEVDNWGFDKKPVSVPSRGGARSSSFGSGFRDSGSRDEAVGRPRLVLEPRSNSSNNNNDNVGNVAKANPFGAARPREEVLAEKGLDWKKLESEIEAKKVNVGVGGGGSRPTSSQGSRPTSSQSNRSESVGVGGSGGGGVEVQQRSKVNPFGDAKPREVLLEEKGLDWRKIDLQLEQRRADRPETDEERALKDDIEILKKDHEKESGKDVSQGTGGEETNLRCLIESKERDLEILKKELDDKIRFSQRPVERPGSGSGRPGSGAGRPGSGAGRYMGFSERPPSRSGSFGDYRSAEMMDRPRSRDSRGTGDVRIGPGEDMRGGFQGNRDRGFGNNRNFNRSASRW